LYQAVRELSVPAYPATVRAYRQSARWPIGPTRVAAYLGAMTTYTTPQFATGLSDRPVRPESSLNRARPASAAPYRTAGVTNEAALMNDGRTPDWQPGASKRGVPKAAIGALGAAMVGGIALAIVLLAPSNKVTKQVMPDPIAQAAATNSATPKADDTTDAAVSAMDKQAPAAGNAAADSTTTQQAAPAAADVAPAAAVPAPVEAVTPKAAPVATAPVARTPKARTAPAPTPRVAPEPVQAAPVAVTPSVVAPADVQPPAMQQTPDTPTVTPSTPAPVPTQPTTDTPAPVPAPAE
jgi:hypothetical protein